MIGQLGLVGCGLIGGSFALALKRAGAVQRVVGYSATARTRERARALGVIDAVAESAAQAAQGSDVVLVAVPVAATEATLAAVRDALDAHALLMDAGSTKGDVVQAARRTLGTRIAQFVPAHPIAGKETAGVEHAEATLYEQRRCILTPLPENARALIDRAQAIWRAVGCRVSSMSAHDHDAAFAAVSHLPHLLAYAYVNGIASQPQRDTWLALAGPGFRDFSRIAASDPVVWRDILLANRDETTRQIAAFRAALQAFEHALGQGDGAAIQSLIAQASDVRAPWRLGQADALPPTPED